MIEWRWFGFARYHRLPSVQCGSCDFARRVGGAGEICAMHEWLCTLAHNLAVGAALCASFRLGRAWQAEYLTAQWNGGGWTYPFEPGCGKAAP